MLFLACACFVTAVCGFTGSFFIKWTEVDEGNYAPGVSAKHEEIKTEEPWVMDSTFEDSVFNWYMMIFQRCCIESLVDGLLFILCPFLQHQLNLKPHEA